jgi:hypothetical protein
MSIIGALIALVIALVLIGLAWWVVNQLLPLIPLPPPIATIINVILIIILALIVLYVLLQLLGMLGVPVPLFHNSLR